MVNCSVYNTRDAAGGGGAPLMRGVAVSSTTTYYSSVFSGIHASGWRAHFQWTGDPTGTITLWYSDKPDPSLADDSDWTQDSGFSPTNPAGSASKFGTDQTGKHARLKRFKYVNASGSGTLYCDVTHQRTA